jgi:hypothetical protein
VPGSIKMLRPALPVWFDAPSVNTGILFGSECSVASECPRKGITNKPQRTRTE